MSWDLRRSWGWRRCSCATWSKVQSGGYGMPLYTAEALVLRTYKLGEADRIVVFLTRDRGKKRGVAPNARKSRKRFGAALEPLTEVRVSYFEKERRELVGLNYAEPVRSPLSAVEPGGARLQPLLRRADRRVGGRRGRGREAVSAGHVGARGAAVAARRLKRWRGTSNAGCCGCKACIRRIWRCRAARRRSSTACAGWRRATWSHSAPAAACCGRLSSFIGS